MLSMPKVGDRFFDKAVGNATRGLKEPKITEVEVVRVGRKYFTCLELEYLGRTGSTKHLETEYYIDRDTYREKTNYCQDHSLYPSIQAIADESEAMALRGELRALFGGRAGPGLSLQALREISEIVKKDKAAHSDV